TCQSRRWSTRSGALTGRATRPPWPPAGDGTPEPGSAAPAPGVPAGDVPDQPAGDAPEPAALATGASGTDADGSMVLERDDRRRAAAGGRRQERHARGDVPRHPA